MRISRSVGIVGALLSTGILLSTSLLLQKSANADPPLRFDFGNATTQPNTVAIGATASFTPEIGYGWLDTSELAIRDRGKTDDLKRDFIMGRAARIFRIAGLKPGRYLLTAVSGDTDYGDHATKISVNGNPITFPLMAPATMEFMTLTATVNATDTLDITFDSPQNNWVINALSLEPAISEVKPTIVKESITPEPAKSTWDAEVFKTDPTKPLLDKFRSDSKNKPRDFQATNLTRADYLKLIAGEVDFWKTKQDGNGAIIDPYSKNEVQYSTPAFANASAVLIARAGRKDLIEPACKAMDWATSSLAQRRAANSHEDFYPTMIAHAYMLLKPQVPAARAARWEADIRGFDPYKTYRQAMGSMNWNIVSSSGEFLFQKLGLRDKANRYVADSFAAQGHHFASPYGLYLEGPLAYDHFPRIFLADVLAQGYDGPYSSELGIALQRAAITSLFMQSPWGELPAGGRSAHHQWNEAEQCVTYEIYAAKAKSEGDEPLAGIYKRAAHLALSSMQRWVRPSGEMQIVKNWVDPQQRHAYEGYSAHSQYNLLSMAMLALAYENAASTETVSECPTPADMGGYVFDVADLHKVFANAGGTYVELDTQADSHYDATGLIRIHMKGISPQLGPSDSLVAHASYQSPNPVPMTTGVGVAWKGKDGTWQTLGSMDKDKIKKWSVTPISQSPDKVAFDVTYEGDLNGVTRIIEHYVLTSGQVELMTEVPGYEGQLRYQWPVLADDGRTKSTITVADELISVSQDGGKTTQTFRARGAQNVHVGEALYSNHNGWARLATADYQRVGRISIIIAAKQ